MLSLKTIHNHRRSPQLDSRQAPQPASAGRQAPSRTSSLSIRFLPRNPHNTKQKPPRLSVSALKRTSPSHAPSHPVNPGLPNDPNPIFGHSPTPPHAKSATHSPLPPLLHLTSSPPKTPQLRVISKSPCLRVEDPLPPEYPLPPERPLPKLRQFPPSRPLDRVNDVDSHATVEIAIRRLPVRGSYGQAVILTGNRAENRNRADRGTRS
jgi:hypothetical protein